MDLGKHLLVDREILKKEIEIANLTEKDRVLEIGAGTGILTEELAKRAGKVLSFEIDERFRGNLEELEKKYRNLKMIYDNALKYNWKNYNKIVSNIPYFLSEAVILKSIEAGTEELVLVVGEKFKEKLFSEENKIGTITNLFYEIIPITPVTKNSFYPKPKVNSYMIKLTRKNPKNKTEEILRKVVIKRGKIKNAIIYVLVENGKTKNQARQIIKKMNINKAILEKPTGKLTGKFILRLREDLKIIC